MDNKKQLEEIRLMLEEQQTTLENGISSIRREHEESFLLIERVLEILSSQKEDR